MGCTITAEYEPVGGEFTFADGTTFGLYQPDDRDWSRRGGVMFRVDDLEATVTAGAVRKEAASRVLFVRMMLLFRQCDHCERRLALFLRGRCNEIVAQCRWLKVDQRYLTNGACRRSLDDLRMRRPILGRSHAVSARADRSRRRHKNSGRICCTCPARKSGNPSPASIGRHGARRSRVARPNR